MVFGLSSKQVGPGQPDNYLDPPSGVWCFLLDFLVPIEYHPELRGLRLGNAEQDQEPFSSSMNQGTRLGLKWRLQDNSLALRDESFPFDPE